MENEAWKYDAVPEILNGKNIFDFVDPEIERKIMQMEEEQKNLVMPGEELLTEKERYENEVLEGVRDVKHNKKMESLLHNKRILSKKKLDVKGLKEKLQKKGMDSSKAEQRLREKQDQRTLRKMQRNPN